MLRKNRKRRQDDDIGPSTGIMKWTNKLCRLVLFPVIHPVAFISAIVIAALVILAVPAYFGIEFKDTFAWYRHQFDRSYSQVQTVVSQKNVEVLVDEAENKIKAMAGLGVNVKTIDKKPNNKELVAYEVQQNVVRRAFHQKTAGSGVDEGGRSDVRFKRAPGLGLVYLDNPEKQKEIEKDIKEIYDKFIEFFGTDEIVTTNKFADDLIGAFNDFAEGGEKVDFKDKIQTLDTYKFFNVSEFNNSYENFLENSLGGFSSHKEIYDVGIIFDNELGLYAVPFYETFNKIIENPDSVENAKECVEFFLNNDKFSANIIKRVAQKHDNFMEIVNKLLNTNYTLDELLEHYKSRYLENKIFSSTTVLYKSKAFSKTLGIIEEDIEKPNLEGIDLSKIGRNDPCPCGSGKKFKKCCGANL